MTDTATARTWTLELPPGLDMLSLNGREHWAERYRRNEALKKAAWAMTLRTKVPRLDRVTITAEYQPPPDWRDRDADNIAPSVKGAIDGIRAARVFPDDDSSHVLAVTCRIGADFPAGRMVLHITEVTG